MKYSNVFSAQANVSMQILHCRPYCFFVLRFSTCPKILIFRYRFYANSRAEDAAERQNCSVAHEDDVTAAPTYVHTSRESREEWMYV